MINRVSTILVIIVDLQVPYGSKVDLSSMQHEVQQVERRTSGWKGWDLGPSSGLRGGTQVGESPLTGKADEKEVKEQEEQPRNAVDDFLAKQLKWRKRREEGIFSEEKRHKGDDNGENLSALHYGSAATDLNKILESELNGVECEDLGENLIDECESEEEVEIGNQGELNGQGLSDEEEVSTAMKFLQELDSMSTYICSPRLIVRGEYEGIVNGSMFKLIVRRRTEGTYVDWSLFNLDTRKQLLMIKGEMSYPYNLTRSAKEVGGVKVNGGRAWEGWAYGFCDFSELSDSFVNDPRDVHIDLLEAVFWTDHVYNSYHVSGPLCKNETKREDIDCTEGACGLRIWSIMITTFTTILEEHDLKPTTFEKDQKLQTVFMSLVRFYDGHFNIAIHTDHRIGTTDEGVIWLSPVKNRCFNDSVAGVDRRLLEKAKQIHRTRPARVHDGEEGADGDVSQVRLSNIRWGERGGGQPLQSA